MASTSETLSIAASESTTAEKGPAATEPLPATAATATATGPSPALTASASAYSLTALGIDDVLTKNKVQFARETLATGQERLYVPLPLASPDSTKDGGSLSLYVTTLTGAGGRPAYSIHIECGRLLPGAPRDLIVTSGLAEMNRVVRFGTFYRGFTSGVIGYRLSTPLPTYIDHNNAVLLKMVVGRIFFDDYRSAVETVSQWFPFVEELQFSTTLRIEDVVAALHLSLMPEAQRRAVQEALEQQKKQQKQQQASKPASQVVG